jgi:hypothetical protein
VEALGEFRIKTNAFSAEYGRTGSAITSFAYRSGTNDLHGSIYDFERNEAFNAKGFYRQATWDRKHNHGFTAGGPVYFPKLYNGRNALSKQKSTATVRFHGFDIRSPGAGK